MHCLPVNYVESESICPYMKKIIVQYTENKLKTHFVLLIDPLGTG